MLKPTFRFFIIPLGAVVTLASMSAQNAPRAQHDGALRRVRDHDGEARLLSELAAGRAMVERQFAMFDAAHSWKYLIEAQKWEHLAQAEIASHFIECNACIAPERSATA